MKKSTFFILLALLANITNAQITKRNWLVGGTASISSLKSNSDANVHYKQTTIQISPMVGYFIKDKFVAGLKPSIISGNNSIANSNVIFNVGPFARYYFLDKQKVGNIYSEVSYSYGTISNSGQSSQHLNNFSISFAPVIFFNTSVALEFPITYTLSKVKGFAGSNTELKFGAGFMFHLEKEK